jgi:putative transcriptional regulator
MRANYSKLFNILKSRNITQNDFRIDVKLSNATIQNLRHNKNVTIDTICRICDYLNVHPNDILEWEEVDPEEIRLQGEIEDLQKQLAELKKAKKR